MERIMEVANQIHKSKTSDWKETVTTTKGKNEAECVGLLSPYDDGSKKSRTELSWKPEHGTFLDACAWFRRDGSF